VVKKTKGIQKSPSDGAGKTKDFQAGGEEKRHDSSGIYAYDTKNNSRWGKGEFGKGRFIETGILGVQNNKISYYHKNKSSFRK